MTRTAKLRWLDGGVEDVPPHGDIIGHVRARTKTRSDIWIEHTDSADVVKIDREVAAIIEFAEQETQTPTD